MRESSGGGGQRMAAFLGATAAIAAARRAAATAREQAKEGPFGGDSASPRVETTRSHTGLNFL